MRTSDIKSERVVPVLAAKTLLIYFAEYLNSSAMAERLRSGSE